MIANIQIINLVSILQKTSTSKDILNIIVQNSFN
jgi:hypothetical protein